MLLSIDRKCALVALLFCAQTLVAGDFITIVNPINNATVSGSPLVINGTSSRTFFTVRLTLNSTIIGSTLTDNFGNWGFNYPSLGSGTYTITADLLNSNFEVLATNIHTFSVGVGQSIFILSPFEEEDIILSSTMASGFASLGNAMVRLLVDSIVVGTDITDVDGFWQIPFSLLSNGQHTIDAELRVGNTTIASSSVDIIGKIPVQIANQKSQLVVVTGTIPTSGSGSGPGYTYSIANSTVNIVFTPNFAVKPVILATGTNSLKLPMTTTVVSVTTAQTSIAYTAGTQSVHFIALAIV